MVELDENMSQVDRITNMINNKYSAMLRLYKIFILVATVAIFVLFPTILSAQDVQEQVISKATEASSNVSLEDALDNLWVLVAGILVLMMQLGFAMLEAGFSAAKNTVNVLFKNIADACLGILVYFAFGYALMYRPENWQSADLMPQIFGISLPYMFLNGTESRAGAEHLSVYIDFFFQAAFAATAATICSGAVAGRIKPWAYLLLTFLITGLVYPVSGYWVWGGGWLNKQGFHDFAGSVVVHGVGGGAALAIVNILKSRIGKFSRKPIPPEEEKQLLPHSLPLAAMGTFILWIGWYGFNGGSTLGIAGVHTFGIGTVSTPDEVGSIFVNTTISACSSACAVIAYRWFNKSRIDLSTVLNGLLGGLVGITASCDLVTPLKSLIIGGVAGLVVIMGINLLYERKIDDAVGAVPVHFFCGIWGGLATAIFTKITLIQIFGSLLIPAWSYFAIWLSFKFIHSIFGIRVEADEEKRGLDWQEHGESSYLSLEKKEKVETNEY
ncbi:MAG: ammonium transporter [Okeania sp. SIO3B5]|uniref:ammonium transporter n=1 Tax=Okeania sp. SIO3B5 TaxID=2607811 RepID=UPI0013FE7785|nr:ammonium transporter [Okeania sp. SIO3B5]NEO58313.1 ammonium transporter [Okeania sp. SIO3B5]